MNVMVMDVEGTDGRERGEDQVSICMVRKCKRRVYIEDVVGLRAQISSLFVGIVRGLDHQPMGAPGRTVPRRKYGAVEDCV